MTTGHPRIPSVPFLAGAYLGGTVVATVLGTPWLVTLAVAAFAASSVVMLGRWPLPRTALLLGAIAIGTLAHARFDVAMSYQFGVVLPLGSHDVVGTVREGVRVRGLTVRFDLDLETLDGGATQGGIRVVLPAPLTPIKTGDRLRLTLDLEVPPEVEAFDYAAFLRSRDIQAVAAFPRSWEYLGRADTGVFDRLPAIRRWVTGRIERALPEPESSLAAGVLVGERRSMSDDLTEALRTTGTTHLVVVSGQNVALLLGIAIAMLTLWLPRRRAALVALVGLLGPYVLLVGADPPVVRAAIMSVGIVIASIFGRRTPGWIYLVYAAALMIAWNPLYAVDVAFQLSAMATAGVIILAPALTEAALDRLQWPAGGLRGTLLELTTTATAATLAVLPVQVAVFERISLIAIPANIVVAPLYEGSVAAAALSALIGSVAPLIEPLRPVLLIVPAAFIWVVRLFAGIPAAEFPVVLPLPVGIGWYLALAALVWWLDRRNVVPQVLDQGSHSGLGWSVGLAAVAIGLWIMVLQPGDSRVRVSILDVGQGLAVLIEDRSQTVLVDVGPPDGAVIAALPARIGQVDAVVLTHSNADHAGGLYPLLNRVDVATLLASDRTMRELEAISESVAFAEPFDIGDELRLSDRAALEVLSPPVATIGGGHASANDSSLVLLVTVGERRLLITGDIEGGAEAWLVESGQPLGADVLVVAHHGSKSSSTTEFIEAVRPAIAVIPVGRNSYGHPAEEVLARFSDVTLYRTDTNGSVTFSSDGDRLWVRSER